MPRRKGQAEKIDSGQSQHALAAKAWSGRFADDGKGAEVSEFVLLSFYALGLASELPTAKYLRAVRMIHEEIGLRVLDALFHGDREFFKKLAEFTQESHSLSEATEGGKSLPLDPVLWRILVIKKEGLQPPDGRALWTSGSLADHLSANGTPCDRDEARRKAKLVGLQLDPKRGRR